MRLLLILSILSLSACVGTNPFTDKKYDQNIPKIDDKPFNLGTSPDVLKPISRLGQEPVATATLKGTPPEAANCLEKAMQGTFKIPSDFIQNTEFPDKTHTVSLINPATNQAGISIDLRSKSQATEASMYDNGTVVSASWKRLLKQCE